MELTFFGGHKAGDIQHTSGSQNVKIRATYTHSMYFETASGRVQKNSASCGRDLDGLSPHNADLPALKIRLIFREKVNKN